MVAAVLLQPGKTDAGALFTSNVSSSAFAPRGTATVLSKITIAAAVVFMLSALLLSMPAISGNVSVLSANPETSSESAPATDTNTNTESNANVAVSEANVANANVSSNTNANTSAEANANTPAKNAPAANAANKASNANAKK